MINKALTKELKELANKFLLAETKSTKNVCTTQAKFLLESLGLCENLSFNQMYKQLGFSYLMGKNSSSKIEKGLKENINSYVLYLSASDNSGFDLCKYASKFCREICLVESGRSLMEQKNGNIHKSRLLKTWLYQFNEPLFNELLEFELRKAQNSYIKTGIKFCVRLNGTSDLNFYSIMDKFTNIQFYDYTKDINRVLNSCGENNHHITFSFSGSNFAHCRQAIKQGFNVAVPVLKSDFKKILSDFNEFCFNGDTTDLRFLDKQKGKICLLSVKGNHKDENSFLLSYESFNNLLNKVHLN